MAYANRYSRLQRQRSSRRSRVSPVSPSRLHTGSAVARLMESRSTDRDNFGASNQPGRPYRRHSNRILFTFDSCRMKQGQAMLYVSSVSSHMIEISLGQRIRELRDKAALSLRGLANRIGISSPFLSDIELGRRFPSEEILAKLADALDVSPDELKQYDTRGPIADLKRLMDSDPKLGFAFKRKRRMNSSASTVIVFCWAS